MEVGGTKGTKIVEFSWRFTSEKASLRSCVSISS